MLAPALVPPTGIPSGVARRISSRRRAADDGRQPQLVAAGDEHPRCMPAGPPESSRSPSARLWKSRVSTRPASSRSTGPRSARRCRPACWRSGSPRCAPRSRRRVAQKRLRMQRRLSLSSAPRWARSSRAVRRRPPCWDTVCCGFLACVAIRVDQRSNIPRRTTAPSRTCGTHPPAGGGPHRPPPAPADRHRPPPRPGPCRPGVGRPRCW